MVSDWSGSRYSLVAKSKICSQSMWSGTSAVHSPKARYCRSRAPERFEAARAHTYALEAGEHSASMPMACCRVPSV
jgi:hypothetical protein